MEIKNNEGGKIVHLYQIFTLVKDKKIARLNLNKLLGHIEYLDIDNFTDGSLYGPEIKEIRDKVLVATAHRLFIERKYDELEIMRAIDLAIFDLELIRKQKIRTSEKALRQDLGDKETPLDSDMVARKISTFLISYIESCIENGHHYSSQLNQKLRACCRAMARYYEWIKGSHPDQFPSIREFAKQVHNFNADLTVVTYSDKQFITGTDD